MSYDIRSNTIDPKRLLASGSAQRTALLETMLVQHGFERARQNGSHIHFKHELIPELVTIVEGSDLPDYMRLASTACIEVIEKKQERAKERLHELKDKFSTIANDTSGSLKSAE